MTKEKLQKNAIDVVWEDYKGENIIIVSHPDLGVCRCVAPNEGRPAGCSTFLGQKLARIQFLRIL